MSSEEAANAMRDHLDRLRRVPCLRNATLFAAVEGNYGAQTAVAVSRVFREYRPYSIFADNAGNGRGSKRRRTGNSLRDGGRSSARGADARLYVTTKEEDKDRQVNIVRSALNNTTAHKGIHVLEDMAVTDDSLTTEMGTLGMNEPMPYGARRTKHMLKKFCDQLSQYRRVTKLARVGNEAWQADKSKWSGKGGGNNDDLAMAFLIAMQRMTTMQNASRYELEGMLTN